MNSERCTQRTTLIVRMREGDYTSQFCMGAREQVACDALEQRCEKPEFFTTRSKLLEQFDFLRKAQNAPRES